MLCHLPLFACLALTPTQDALRIADEALLLDLYAQAVDVADKTKRAVHLQDSNGYTFHIIHPE